MGNPYSTVKGLLSDVVGTSDVFEVVSDLSRCWASSYLLPQEEVLYVLQSVRQEFAFSNCALVKVSADTSTTTRRLVERFEYKSNRVDHVKFESTGILYRDCVLEFCMGNTQFKLDIARDKEGEVKGLYKTLVLLGQKQEENEREWELVQQAVTSTKETVRLSGATGQSDETLKWMKVQYERTHPQCYKTLITSVFEAVRAERNEAGYIKTLMAPRV